MLRHSIPLREANQECCGKEEVRAKGVRSGKSKGEGGSDGEDDSDGDGAASGTKTGTTERGVYV